MKHKLLPLSVTMHYILLVLREPNHGYAVMQKVQELSSNKVILAPGTLYGAIENLSKHGWIRQVDEVDRRKIYHITDEGMEILEKERERLLHIINLY
ncbi:PadR family transcriptional regulator [Macrococcoides canis]|uniref:PadR family transcriptional regulator n=1 Tax=Macrococcoides canis TaxID=1855823 RepID=UPI0020B6B196|nr:helix-turn-helix transcriptional regulator [Macrococcus canis]UTH07149.1 helix-turn-helix transcriptional regulator [Macrococcus canis]